MTLRVMSFNIRNGRAVHDGWNAWWLRRRATVDTIARLEPDVVGLQEVYWFQLGYLLRSLSQFRSAGAGRADGRRRGELAPVLFSTRRFVLERTATRWLGDTPDVAGSRTWGNRLPRVATLAWLRERGSGERLGVVNAHLDDSSAEVRRRSVELALQWLSEEADRPWLVVGDLNARPGEPALAALAAAGYRDTLAGHSTGTAHAFTGGDRGPRLDYVLAPPPFVVERAAVVRHRPRGRLPSDHWPVVADLGLAPPGGSAAR